MDPRETPYNGLVAHVSLRGQVDAKRFAEGERRLVQAATAEIRSDPDGPREREMLLGEPFLVLDEKDGWAFGQAEANGYVGWVDASALSRDAPEPTHRVSVARTYGKGRPELKTTEPHTFLPFGARIHVKEETDGWAQIVGFGGDALYVPAMHLCQAGHRFGDPVRVARMFLGTPYLWGGNSAFGIDCSGLVQAAMLATGISCLGDSDQQRARLGEEIALDAARRRGDLYFWAGHVGILSDPETLIHATAGYMSTVEEPLDDAIRRIEASEGKRVLKRRRVSVPSAA